MCILKWWFDDSFPQTLSYLWIICLRQKFCMEYSLCRKVNNYKYNSWHRNVLTLKFVLGTGCTTHILMYALVHVGWSRDLHLKDIPFIYWLFK